MFRDAIRAVLMTCSHLEVVGEAHDGESSVHQALTKKPNLMLLRFRLPDFSGIEVLRRLGEAVAQTKILFVTYGMDREQTLEALQLGARGVLTTDASAELLKKAIRCVLAGEYWIGRDVMAEWLENSRRKTTPAQSLTVRERQVVSELLTGKTNREIAGALAISNETVKFHIRNIYDKCGVSNRMELVMFLNAQSGG